MSVIMLINIVEVSNIFSVLIIFLVFCVMVVFILRLHSDDFGMTSVHYNHRGPTRPLPVNKVINPFAFNLMSEHCKINDVVCVVSSQVRWSLLPLWGVDITALHEAISSRWSWNEFRQEVIKVDGKFLSEACLCTAKPQSYSEVTQLQLHLSPPMEIDEVQFGRPPRTRYPFVLLLISLDEIDSEDIQVGAMVIVIHIKDSVCPAASCLILQYLKMTNGQLTDLKQLYVSSESDGDDVAASSTDPNSQSGTQCLICRAAPASRALLPCRHVCSCRQCFEQLDKCPMCRSIIQTYFCILEEDPLVAEVDNTDEMESELSRHLGSQTWNQRFQRWNDWLNRTLGFT